MEGGGWGESVSGVESLRKHRFRDGEGRGSGMLVRGITDFVGEKAARVERNAQRLHPGQGDDRRREEEGVTLSGGCYIRCYSHTIEGIYSPEMNRRLKH